MPPSANPCELSLFSAQNTTNPGLRGESRATCPRRVLFPPWPISQGYLLFFNPEVLCHTQNGNVKPEKDATVVDGILKRLPRFRVKRKSHFAKRSRISARTSLPGIGFTCPDRSSINRRLATFTHSRSISGSGVFNVRNNASTSSIKSTSSTLISNFAAVPSASSQEHPRMCREQCRTRSHS